MGARTSARHSFTLFHEATAFKGASEGGTSASERAGKTPSISSWLGSLRAPRGAVLDAREHDKKPIRDIATWLPVTLYILNDVLNGTFTLIPYIMGFNGWIAGIAVIWMMGLVGYYTSNLLYRMSIVFPGAVSMGDLSYYLNRSVFGMTVTFILAYLLMFLTSSQQLSMAASMFQYVAAGGKYIIYLPAWLVIMVLVLIPLSQVRTLRSVFFFNIFNVSAVLIFWGIAMGVNLYKIIAIGNDVPTKLLPAAEDLRFWDNQALNSWQVGFPLGGAVIAFQFFYYQVCVGRSGLRRVRLPCNRALTFASVSFRWIDCFYEGRHPRGTHKRTNTCTQATPLLTFHSSDALAALDSFRSSPKWRSQSTFPRPTAWRRPSSSASTPSPPFSST